MMKNLFLLLVVAGIVGGVYYFTVKPVYPSPEIQNLSTTGTVMANINQVVTGEYDALIPEGEGFKYSYVSGYKHIYTYKDLGILIGIDDPNTDEFSTPTANTIFSRKGNKVYQTDKPQDYVEMFPLEKNMSFDEIIRTKHLPKGCYLVGYDGENDFGRKLAGTKILMVASSPEGNAAATQECRPDDEDKTSESFIQYIYHPDYPDKYYKYSIQDACAPSCGVFNIFQIQ